MVGAAGPENAPSANAAASSGATNTQAAALFRKGMSVDDVAAQLGRARSTTLQYLCDFLRVEPPRSVATWVSDDVYRQVADAASRVGAEKLKPIFEALDGMVSFDDIRIVVTHLNAHGG